MMNFVWLKARQLRRVWAACLLSVPMLVACAKPTLSVSLHGVNYSGQVFSFIVIDPNNPNNSGGSGLIDPYAAGGTECCYELPKKWRPGMKIAIRSTHSVGKLADNTLRDVVENHSVDVPRYADGKPGELWVLRTADGSVDLVSSDFQPDHTRWPGKVKGWPVPSLEYQRERWDLYIDHERGGVKLYEGLLAELQATPDQAAIDEWNYLLEHDKQLLKGFSGPNDKKFREKLWSDYEGGLKRSRQQLQRLTERRP
jgi:hypothetical protein